MPAGDRTGPEGNGPKTGRGLGDCDTTSTTQQNNSMSFGRGSGFGAGRGFGRGYGFGVGRGRNSGRAFGFGRGCRFLSDVPFNTASEKDLIEFRLKSLEAEKEFLEKRLSELSN